MQPTVTRVKTPLHPRYRSPPALLQPYKSRTLLCFYFFLALPTPRHYLFVHVLIGCLSALEYKLFVLFAAVSPCVEECSICIVEWIFELVWVSLQILWEDVVWIIISRELIFAFTNRCRPCFCDGWESGCWKTHSTSCRKGSWANWRERLSEEGKCPDVLIFINKSRTELLLQVVDGRCIIQLLQNYWPWFFFLFHDFSTNFWPRFYSGEPRQPPTMYSSCC